MNSENRVWDNLKAEYLSQAEKAIVAVEHPRKKEVIEDVKAHLDRRFSELNPEQKTKENFQRIISEMGPPSDYAELLGEKPPIPPAEMGIWRRFSVNAALSIVIIAAIILLCQILDSYVFYRWKVVFSSQPAKADEFVVNTYMTFQGRYVDKINYPFVNDPNVIGSWVSVDLVRDQQEFVPGQKHWRWDLWFKGITFFKGGTTNWACQWKGGTTNWVCQWTKGLVLAQFGERIASHYIIKTIDGAQYMFFEWKSGDYTILHRKPIWYVLAKAESKGLTNIPQSLSTSNSK